jgi:hypothetical protein
MGKIKIEIKWAVIFMAMMLLWMVLEKLVGLHDQHIDKHMIYTNFVAIPAIIIYVFALLDKRKNFYRGSMTYIQGLVSGLIITLIVTVFTPLTQYITTTFITPDYFNNAIDYTVSSGMMSQEEAENYFNTNSYIKQAVVGAPIMGIVTTAIVAIFARKK